MKLVVFPRLWGLPSVSPFCVKAETWLRMAGVAYEVSYTAAPIGAPYGKLPYLEDDGRRVPDSRAIVAYVTDKHAVRLDAALSARDRAVGDAVARMLEEHLYFVMLHDRWLTEDGWSVLRDAYFGTIPALLRPFAPPLFRRRVARDVWGHGVGRLPEAEIHAQGRRDVDAVADVLGDRPYLLGDDPHGADATAFGFLASYLWCPIPSPVKDRIEERRGLVAYCERMRDRFFPELAEPVRRAVGA